VTSYSRAVTGAVDAVVVLELNELSPPLVQRFEAAGDLPNFARLRRTSRTFVTDAAEPPGRLNPWVQWVTVHTGVDLDHHGVLKLGEGRTNTQPTIADAVARAGRDVWLCGPMNVVPTEPVRGWWLPDPWNPSDRPEPAELAPFADFVRANVQEHSNPANRFSPAGAARFLAAGLRRGVRPSSLAATAVQLVGERTGRRPRWRRAALLDRFQWDLFERHVRTARPAVSTYFSNTTAHYQHMYWRHMDPEPFALKPTAEERARYGDAIRRGYLEMDRLIGRALDLVDDRTALVFVTALSQQAYTEADDEGGNRFHRPHDIETFVRGLGLDGVTGVSPVMAAQFHVYFVDEPSARAAEEALAGASVDGRPAFGIRRVGTDILLGVSIVSDVPPDARLAVPATGRTLDFHQHVYRAETAKSGWHHPHGLLWLQVPGLPPGDEPTPVPLTAVAPTILRLVGVAAPPSMATSSLL
jgi:hypothetical protein